MVLLLGIIGIGLFLLGYPAVQACATAVTFMDAVQKADEPAIKKLPGKETDPFIKNISTQLQGATYKIASTDRNKDGTYSVKFTVDKSKTLKNATVITQGSSVSKFLLNTSNGAQNTSTDSSSAPTPTVVKTDSTCITPADWAKMNNVNPSDGLKTIRNPLLYASVFFKPDSLEYSYPDVMEDEYKRQAAFINSPVATGKEYTVHLTGSVYKDFTTDPGKSLAMQRTEKVRAELIKHGVAASKVVADLPNRHEYGQDDRFAEIYRRVDVDIVVPDRCVTPEE